MPVALQTRGWVLQNTVLSYAGITVIALQVLILLLETEHYGDTVRPQTALFSMPRTTFNE